MPVPIDVMLRLTGSNPRRREKFRRAIISFVQRLSRRRMLAALAPALGAGAAAKAGLLGADARAGSSNGQSAAPAPAAHDHGRATAHPGFRAGETVDHQANGFHPNEILRDFDEGRTRRLASGRVLREWELVAQDREIEVAPGVKFAAWTYNGRIPGPTLRCREGERLRIRFGNGSAHPHTIHFHGIHPASMDGVPDIGVGVIEAGQERRLRVRCRSVRPSPLPLPRTPPRRPHRQGNVRRLRHRSQAGPSRGRRAGDGHERLRHRLRPVQRALCRQLDRVRPRGRSP